MTLFNTLDPVERDPLLEGMANFQKAVAEHATNSTVLRNVTSLTQLTEDERHLVWLTMREKGKSVNLPYAVNELLPLKANRGRSKEATRAALYRAANRLYTRGLAEVKKDPVGLVLIVIDEGAIHRLVLADRAQHINLMREPSEIPTRGSQTKKQSRKKYNDVPLNANGYRLEAINYARGVKMMDRVDRGYINGLFNRYNDETLEKIFALVDEATGDTLGAEYSTRFNDTKKAAANLRKFDHAIDVSLRDYWRCCFLTLTTDPKIFDSNWDANRHVGLAWNKFMAFLTKRLGSRPKYVAVYEYTKKGYIHIHALVFLDYLLDHKEISKAWARIGQGEIVYVYNLYNVKDRTGSRSWLWGKRRPRRAKVRSGNDYIAKYLKKSLFAQSDFYDSQANIQSLYWVFNKRFFTCSRALTPPKEGGEEETPEEIRARYFFDGVYPAEDELWRIDRMIYRRGIPWEPDAANAGGDAG